MKFCRRVHCHGVLLLLLFITSSTIRPVSGQGYQQEDDYSYQDYQDNGGYVQQDNLYADYVNKQAEKQAGGGGPGLFKTCAFGACAWFVGGKIHSKRAVNKIKKKHAKDQKELYMQYYNDVMTLSQQNAELQYVVDQYVAQTKQQLEQEFRVADADNDHRVSRAEFNMYRNNYLRNNPDMNPNDFPKFEHFDPDSDGYISTKEYDAYYDKNL